jgi:hypothetical protein
MNWHKRITIILAVLVCAELLAGSLELDAARAAGPIFEIFSDSLQQYYLDAAFNPATGSYLVVWSTMQGSYTEDLWARPVLLDGTLLPAFNIDSVAGNTMKKVAITADLTRARFLVVVQYNDHSGYNQILSHTVNWNGTQISPAVNYSTGGWWDSAAGPSVVYNPQMDEYLLVYEDTSDTNCSYAKVLAVRMDPESLIPSSPVEVGGCDSSEYAYYGRAAYHADSNHYQLIYDRVDLATSDDYLTTRSLSADLSQVGAAVEVASGVRYATDMSIASGPGGFLVAYMGRDDNDYFQVYGQFIGPYGALLGSSVQITNEQIEQYAWYVPRASFFGSLGYVVAWSFLPSTTPPDSFDAYYRFVPDRSEQPQATQMLLAGGSSHQSFPVVSCVPEMQCLLIFTDDKSGDYDLFGRQVYLTRQSLPLVAK